jgi:hypothetical protein
VTGTDFLIQKALGGRPVVLVQEGTFKYEDRAGFIRKCVRIAGDRPLLFKLHPNERPDRAAREIRELAPRALIFTEGNTSHMIANCDVLVTKYSSVVYLALALGREVHADLTLEGLRPVSDGPAGVYELQREATTRRLVVAVGYQFRFHPTLRRIKAWLDDGAVGEAVSARAHARRSLGGVSS